MVIEIGPGLGTLTKYLLEKAGKVLCIELDTRMIKILEDRFDIYKNFEVINEDVLKVNLNQIIKENKINISELQPYNLRTHNKPDLLLQDMSRFLFFQLLLHT